MDYMERTKILLGTDRPELSNSPRNKYVPVIKLYDYSVKGIYFKNFVKIFIESIKNIKVF